MQPIKIKQEKWSRWIVQLCVFTELNTHTHTHSHSHQQPESDHRRKMKNQSDKRWKVSFIESTGAIVECVTNTAIHLEKKKRSRWPSIESQREEEERKESRPRVQSDVIIRAKVSRKLCYLSLSLSLRAGLDFRRWVKRKIEETKSE